jgi:hypothetical protein
MTEKTEATGVFIFDQDSKRFHRFRIQADDGIIGTLYVPKDCEGTPRKIVLDYKPERVDLE